eukprot:01012.XXX_3891_2810_1 [CDS] Oithona nana genome sequencing.
MDYDKCEESLHYIRQQTSLRPFLGLICGSGLGGIGNLVADVCEIQYEDIPHFPKSTAPGHKSRLLLGTLNKVPVVVMQGRFHLYEGYNIHQCAIHIRVLYLLGIKGLIVTNAAGGLSASLKVGDIMLLKDHVNLMSFVGINPLAGPNDERFGPRFFTLNEPYDVEWRAQALQVSNQLGIRSKVKEGVYTMLGGPNFETPAELRMLHMCGVDAVGMSTVHEVVTAKHCGLRCLAFSLITNSCATVTSSALSSSPAAASSAHANVEE